MKIISIIPARGGSKGIPEKNIINIAGKPLIAWTIEQSIKTKSIYKTYVSTNDNQIADISKQYGAEIIWRPEEICGDSATSESAILHALDYLKEKQELEPDYVVFLQATSPLRKKDDINNAIDTIISENSDSLLSVVNSHCFIWGMNQSGLKSINYDYKNRKRRQDFNKQYKENGSIYIFKPNILRKYNNRIGGKIAVYEMDFWQSFEIDSYDDLEFHEWMFQKYMREFYKEISLSNIKLIVYDFDGVMTNNKAILNQEGIESVMVSRSDGLAISIIKRMGIKQIILSTEKNCVVTKRAEKLNIPVLYGIDDKEKVLKRYLKDNQINRENVIYIGNDINDLEAMKIVGLPVAPFDAHKEIKKIARLITIKNGGDGVIRELLDIIKYNKINLLRD